MNDSYVVKKAEDIVLDYLLEWARNYKMSPKEMEEQRRSFAYGNLKLHNPFITRADIDRADEELEKARNFRGDSK